jgi:hypothetical protein
MSSHAIGGGSRFWRVGYGIYELRDAAEPV